MTIPDVPPVALPLVAVAVLLLSAAWIDWRSRVIPNAIPLAVAALYLPFVLLHPEKVGWGVAVAVATGCLAAGFFLFARGVMGGGDVKLITAVALFAGADHIALFGVVMSLAGGALALGSLLWERSGWMIMPLLPLPAAMLRPRPSAAPDPQSVAPPATLPYGIAIAAGGLAVAAAIMTTS